VTNFLDERGASVVIIRSDYPGLAPTERWTGTASVHLKDGTDLKISTGGCLDPHTVLDDLIALLRRRLTPDD
jgi:hypothetical protein